MTLLFVTVLAIFASVNVAKAVDSITIGPGEVYQQPSSSYLQAIGFELLDGGTIIDRTDGRISTFSGGDYSISGGTVDANVMLDLAETRIDISGGTFNGPLEIDRAYADTEISGGTFYDPLQIDRAVGRTEISGGAFYNTVVLDRLSDGAELVLSGGVFDGTVDIRRYQGDVTISGGEFNVALYTDPSFTDGAQPTLTIVGSDWELDRKPLVFANGEADLTGQNGRLTGTLEDGNAFSLFISGGNAPEKLTVVNIPEPSTAAMLFIGAFGFLVRGRRRRTAGHFRLTLTNDS